MAKHLLILILVLCSFITWGQGCTELLSKAEQDYRNGQFDSIKPKLCNCFGIYTTADTNDIRPRKYRSMITAMQKADSLYARELGSFQGYWRDFRMTKAQRKAIGDNYFSFPERSRAFALLGKIYNQLGVMPLSEFFALKAILIDPDQQLQNDNSGFNRIYSQQLKKIREWSIGPLLSWLYALPVSKKNNLPGSYSFKYQSDGKVVQGIQVNYGIKSALILNVGLLVNSTRIVYTQKMTPSANDFDLYHNEKQNWVRLPVLLKWGTMRKFNWLRKNEPLKPKLFIGTGFAINYLEKSSASIINLPGDKALYNYNVAPYRNRWNYELILQLMLRFKLSRNYVNFGFTGSYMLNDIVKQNQVGNSNNTLYNTYGIKENNYKLLTGAWTVTYEFRFNWIKR
jgi:hypothetical protein